MTEYHLSRRELFKRVCPAVMGAAGLHISGPLVAAALNAFPPVQRITGGPHHHWFGYYDKLQFDPTVRYVLGMEVAFEHRSPTADDVIKVGMVDRCTRYEHSS